MHITFSELLEGNYSSDEMIVSLKSVVPFFISYPNLIIPHGYSIADVIPYYISSEDYINPKTDIVNEKIGSPAKLIKMFTDVFQDLFSNAIRGKSRINSIPKVSLQVDIGGTDFQLERIEPSYDDVKNFERARARMGSASGILQVKVMGDTNLTDTQKHNVLLINQLLHRCRNVNVGGES